jgi:hypothetical protein
MRDSMLVDLAAAPEASRSQRWAGDVIALLLLITCWRAWGFLIGHPFQHRHYWTSGHNDDT